jgi:hypothetical protein
MENENKYLNNNQLEVIDKFCKHLGNGFSKECFVDFDYTDVHRMAEELDSRNNNTECMDRIEQGYRMYKYFWEKQGIENMNAEIKTDADGNKITKFDRRIWMFMFKLNREINSGQARIPFEGVSVIRLKSDS